MPSPTPLGLLPPSPERPGPKFQPVDLFHFHPRATNPELWRTTLPLVVRERCKRHKGLIATWTAIHWLIVLHAASGRAHFGMREIAEEAGVGRNELAGPKGHIQRLVNLGLLRIVGYKSFKGLREPRPVYHIDLSELERLSLELVPDVLRERQIDRPPPVAPDPRQLHLSMHTDDADPDHPLPLPGHTWPHEVTGGDAFSASPAGKGQFRHGNRTEVAERTTHTPPSGRVMHGNRTALTQADPLPNPVTHANGPAAHRNGTDRHYQVQALPELVLPASDIGTAPARKRDMDGGNERTNEGVRQPLAPDLLRDLVAQTTAAVIAALQPRLQPASAEAPSVLTHIPPTPGAVGPLNASVLALWQGNGPEPRQRDIQQLALLAGEYDGPTGGHGAYWLGRAILMADLCLGGEQPVTIAYVRRMLRRWCEEGSWGSDREGQESALKATGDVPPRPRIVTEPLPDALQQHPAVRVYIAALHETPNAVQAGQIAEVVSDLDRWRQVLTDWQLNGWAERSVGKMLDRYQKSAVAAPSAEPPPSVSAIHTYPGLTVEQRERWIRKFHAAANPAEKRAVIARLEQEHPR